MPSSFCDCVLSFTEVVPCYLSCFAPHLGSLPMLLPIHQTHRIVWTPQPYPTGWTLCCFQYFANTFSHKHFCMKLLVHNISLGSWLEGKFLGCRPLPFCLDRSCQSFSRECVPMWLPPQESHVGGWPLSMLVTRYITKCLHFFPTWWVFFLIIIEHLLIGHLYFLLVIVYSYSCSWFFYGIVFQWFGRVLCLFRMS